MGAELSGARLEALTDSIARRVTLRASLPVYLTLERKLRVLGAFNCLKQTEKQAWAQRAFRTRRMISHVLTSSTLPKIHRALRLLSEASTKNNTKDMREIAEDIVEHGIEYENLKGIMDAANEVLDANYDQYQTIPISEFAMPEKDKEGDDEMDKTKFMASFTTDIEKQERAAHASMEAIEKMRPNRGLGIGEMPFVDVLKMSSDQWDSVLEIAYKRSVRPSESPPEPKAPKPEEKKENKK